MVKQYWFAVATLVGSTVGVGLYGIPFTFQKAGFGVGLLFLIGVSGLVLLSNLMYGEVILRTHGKHQFVGYVDRYLNAWAKKINLFVFWVAIYGALVGILIIVGEFLGNLLSSSFSFSPFGFSTLFLVVVSFLIFKGLRTVSRFDFFMMLLFVLIVLLISVLGASKIDPGNYGLLTGEFWFLPFGVILFAMSGMSGVPLAREVLAGKENFFKSALLRGTLIPAVLYLVFAFSVVGISGESVTPDAISGLLSSLGPSIVFIGSLFGFLTSSTIFLNLSTALKESFQEDFHFKRRWAWFLTILPPYLLFISGVRNFIDIIGLVGGLAIGIESVLLVLLYIKAKKNGDRIPEYSLRLPRPVLYLTMLFFLAGAVYTVLLK